jgi:hypothetical protein
MTKNMLSGLIYAGRLTWLALFLIASSAAFLGAFRAYARGQLGMFAVIVAVVVLAVGIVHVVQRACE